MKFKVKPEKNNKILMILLIILIIFTCLVWLVLREYIYFFVYLSLAIIIFHMYFFTSYILDDKHFITKLGFLKFKINYKKVVKVENLKNKVKICFKKINMKVYPSNVDIFVAKINSKLKK